MLEKGVNSDYHSAPVQPISGPKPPKPRPASSEHLHPEPLVECVVLHQPPTHTLDVIFVHGLYGSLANTWRQGEWRVNYKSDPIKVSLRRPHSIPTACACKWDRDESIDCQCDYLNESKSNKIDYDNIDADAIYEKYRKVLPKDDLFITEKFYNNTLLDKVDNFDTQASFVRDFFENCESEVRKANCQCQSDRCLGCGCTCDVCYSPCWPRDWIKIDYPGARVISINYTSDPYLWRPLWIKESKRQRLHERAEQMMSQLLALGVGEKPIIWVGHSKGGLFIKEIYCKAYEAYLKINKTNGNEDITDETTENNIQDVLNGNIEREMENNNNTKEIDANEAKLTNLINYVFRIQSKDIYNKLQTIRIDEQTENKTIIGENVKNETKEINYVSSIDKEDQEVQRANLWRNSAGFMFYSVPHRGSPLADIKTPITARSIELLEICKECSLVMNLQERWLKATEFSKPAVNSLVETCKTLMSLLWLRIVSVDSADPGIGALSGVSVDHREICKPSSRKCLLYRELKILIQNALQNKKKTYHNKNE
ncbi:PREDICTED: protein SERAC1 [Papilio polytes]|uniref:protein SERAC1 n=1 Tax=Papilio polytes TaxID=76194 RepID=UPI000675CA1F|nr:PREDICTED: protein SERAC1 [Papilio polytes]